jgi:exosome complex component RRP43
MSLPKIGLPGDTFAKFSPHSYLQWTLDQPSGAPSRPNGRAPLAARPFDLNLSSLTHVHGSALVKIGATTAICGVRGETLLASDIPNYRATNRETELMDYELLVPNIELATGSAPQFLPGMPPTDLAQTLSTRLYSLLHKSRLVKADGLRIWWDGFAKDVDQMDEDEEENIETKPVVMGYWVLYIDIFFVSYDGNPFDVVWAAVVAALQDTRLPEARWDPDGEMVLCSSRRKWMELKLDGLPVACTAGVFTEKDAERPSPGHYWLLLDPDGQEEVLCEETITMVVDCSGAETQILSIAKHGGIVASPEHLTAFVKAAEKRWKDFHAVLAKQMEEGKAAS